MKFDIIRRKIEEIALFLIQSFQPSLNYGLFNGNSGIALFLFYYYKYTGNQIYAEKAIDYLNYSIENIDSHFFHTFCTGISGMCWAINHLVSENLLELNNLDINKQFDLYLCRNAILDLNRRNNDFLHGAVGTAYYLLNRIQNKDVKLAENKLIDILVTTSINKENTCFWDFEVNIQTKERCCNISLSHGMSSICIFLTKAYSLGLKQSAIKNILNKSIQFIVNQEVKSNRRHSVFPTYFLDDKFSLPSSSLPFSRLGWCYGDLGIAMAIWQYSQIFKNKEMERKALDIFFFNSERKDLKANAVIDGGICHGTSGIALIFRRMYLYTNIEKFKVTSEYWLEQTLLMAKYHDGFAGYKANMKTPSRGLLDGISGIGLVLLSFLSDDRSQSWDECLLLS